MERQPHGARKRDRFTRAGNPSLKGIGKLTKIMQEPGPPGGIGYAQPCAEYRGKLRYVPGMIRQCLPGRFG